jgi:hypothetical protein
VSEGDFMFEFTATHNTPKPRIQLTAILVRVSMYVF